MLYNYLWKFLSIPKSNKELFCILFQLQMGKGYTERSIAGSLLTAVKDPSWKRTATASMRQLVSQLHISVRVP